MPRKPTVRWHPKGDPSGVWRSDVGPPGRNGRATPVYFRAIPYGPSSSPNRRKAEAALAAYLTERDARRVRAADWTLDDLRLLYLSHARRTAEPVTYDGHRKALAKVVAFRGGGRAYGAIPAAEFTATDLDRAVQAWVGAGHKPTYVVRLVASVRAMLNWAAEPHPGREPERLIAANPVKGYRPRDPGGQVIVIPDAPERYAPGSEIRAFIRFAWRRARARAALPGRNRAAFGGRFEKLTALLVHFAAHAGCRPSEVCRARWEDVDWDGRVLVQRGKTTRRTGKMRVIALTPPLLRMLRAIRRLDGGHPEYVFTHKRAGRGAQQPGTLATWGVPWNGNALCQKVRALRREAIAAGLPLEDEGENRFVMYRLRHSKASDDLMAGGNPSTIAALLGTSTTMLTKRYGHLLTGHLTRSADELLALRRRSQAVRKEDAAG